jgi:hypothetical protein
VSEKEKQVQFSIRIETALLRQIEQLAKEDNRTRNNMIAVLLGKHFAGRERTGK